jgi:hypothetical protein
MGHMHAICIEQTQKNKKKINILDILYSILHKHSKKNLYLTLTTKPKKGFEFVSNLEIFFGFVRYHFFFTVR